MIRNTALRANLMKAAGVSNRTPRIYSQTSNTKDIQLDVRRKLGPIIFTLSQHTITHHSDKSPYQSVSPPTRYSMFILLQCSSVLTLSLLF